MPTHLLVWPFAAVTLLLAAPSATSGEQSPERVVGYGQIAYDGHGPEAWAARARYWQRRALQLHRAMLRRPTVVEAINLACATYGHCADLWRKARCETGGTFSPFAHNPSGAAGLFQFLPSTFDSTPYGPFSIWSAYANALAAGWMHEHGRGGEWSCR